MFFPHASTVYNLGCHIKKNCDSVTPRLKYKQLYKTKMVIPLDAARMTLYSFLIKKPSFKKRQTTMPHKNFPTVTSSAASRDDMSCCPEKSDIVIEDIVQVHIRTWTGMTSHAHINIL